MSLPKLFQASRLGRRFAAGEFAWLSELRCPASTDLTRFRRDATRLAKTFDAVQLTDMPLAQVHVDNLAAGAALAELDLDVIANMTCRDRNIIAQQARFVGAAALGIEHLFCIRGDEPRHGDHPDAHGVYEVDTPALIALGRKLRDEGRFASGRTLEVAPRYLLGAALAPDAPPRCARLDEACRKLEAGADFLISQPVFDLQHFTSFVRELRQRAADRAVRVIAGIAAPPSLETIQLLRSFPQISVPDAVVKRLEQTPVAAREAESIRMAAERIQALEAEGHADGVLIYPLELPAERMTAIADATGLARDRKSEANAAGAFSRDG